MRVRFVVCALACGLACLAPAVATAKPKHKPKVSYYLALGDSLAQGAQPNAAGKTVATNTGYANDLYATEKSKIKHLKLKKLGCLGETTTTMMNGGICKYAKGNQLKQALKFIKAHKIAFITLDIGANDVDGCVKNGSPDLVCFNKGVASIQANVPKIVKALRKAAGKKAKLVGMTYYDPFLAAYLTGPGGQTLAALSVQLADKINGEETSAYMAQQFSVADVSGAYNTDVPFTQMTMLPGYGSVPVSVATLCQLSWNCTRPPRGPNIHANDAGYQTIAKSFAVKL
jgi:lysophospholipase L1-like esterase